MPGDGRRQRPEPQFEDEQFDVNASELYRHQHPASAALGGRFSSPSRPHKDGTKTVSNISGLGTFTAVSCIVQSLVWSCMSVVAALLYRDVIHAPKPPEYTGEKTWNFAALLANLYFSDDAAMPALPLDGLTSPRCMYRFMAATLVLNIVWLVVSSTMLKYVRGGDVSAAKTSVGVWSAGTMAVTVLDVVLSAAVVRDLVVLTDWIGPDVVSFSAADLDILVLCPVAVLVVAARGGFLLIANVTCMILLLHRLSRLDKKESIAGSPSATRREGAISAFVYDNADRNILGVQNPMFIPDEVADHEGSPWSFSKPQRAERDSQGMGYHQGPGRDHDWHNLAHSVGPQKQVLHGNPDDVSHLSWMKRPDEHNESRLRHGTRPSAAPHHRYGYMEARGQPQQSQPPQGYASGQALDLHEHNPRLPRARIHPNAPVYSYPIPPPDYSPPTRRPATGNYMGSRAPRSTRPERF